MTAISAQSASNANSFPAEPARTVLLPGSSATYANRAYLRDLGLRWDPKGHQWHGTTASDVVRILRDQLGLEVRCFGSLDPPARPSPARPPAPTVTLTVVLAGIRKSNPARRPHDGSRTRAEARLAFPSIEEAEEIPTPTRWFTAAEITSGLPDDSREADERAEEYRLRDLGARVKAARAFVSTRPGLADALQRDWRKAARFYARFGITETMFRHGAQTDEIR